MRDLALPALATSSTLLAIYAACLIFVAQHIADRYTPVLYPTVVRRVGLVWLGSLSVVVLLSLASTLVTVAAWTNIVDAVLLVSALALTVFGLYRTFQDAADRERILGMVRRLDHKERITALRDLVWSSVNRGDVTSTEFLLSSAAYGSQEQAELVDWITQYSQLLEQPWLRQAILTNLTSGVFDSKAAELLRPALNQLVVSCLDHEWYDTVREIIFAIMRTVEESPKFSEYHKYIVFDLGFNLHYIGEEGSASERVSKRSPDSLQDARNLYLSKLAAPLRRSVIGDNNPASVTQYCMLLERLAESRIGLMILASQVWEILEGSYKTSLLEQDALESLANMIGECRAYSKDDYPDFIDEESELDSRAAHLALYIVALGYKGQLGRMMGNARFGHSKRMPYRLAMHNDIGEDVYSSVARELGTRLGPRTEANDFFS